jgi:RNA polymerase sigma-70 factor (ECF subfamily)
MAKEDQRYEEAVSLFGPALERLARGYEADPDKRRDLLQEIHVALWRSFRTFDNRCSLRTWVYRVAHNRAASYVRGTRKWIAENVSLDDLTPSPKVVDREGDIDRSRARERLFHIIHRLPPLERQVILLYLEGMDGASIGEISGLSVSNVGTKVQRLKEILLRGVRTGGNNVR